MECGCCEGHCREGRHQGEGGSLRPKYRKSHPSSTVFAIFPRPVTPHPPLPRLPTPHPTSTSSACVPPAAPPRQAQPSPNPVSCQWALHAGFCPAQIHHPLSPPILPAPLQEGLTLLRGTPILSLEQNSVYVSPPPSRQKAPHWLGLMDSASPPA